MSELKTFFSLGRLPEKGETVRINTGCYDGVVTTAGSVYEHRDTVCLCVQGVWREFFWGSITPVPAIKELESSFDERIAQAIRRKLAHNREFAEATVGSLKFDRENNRWFYYAGGDYYDASYLFERLQVREAATFVDR